MIIIGLLAVIALTSQWWLPYDPQAIDLPSRLLAPDSQHWLGTDHLGRDIFSRLLAATRVSLGSVMACLLLVLALGLIVGGSAGLLGGRVDQATMRVADMFMTFPTSILSFFMVGVLGTGLTNVIIAIALSHWAWYARMVRSLVISLRQREFVLASRLSGAGHVRVFIDHLAGAVIPLTPVQILWINMVTAVALGLTLAFEPTEAGAMGVVGGFALAWVNGRLSWDLVYQGMSSTMRITAMVVFILIGARVFSLVFQGVGGRDWIEHMLTGLPGGTVGFLVFVNIFVFIIAFFLDFFEIAFIIIPMLAPTAAKLGIDLIWFGVLICANVQTSFMHPPFGFALFYIRGIAPPSVKSSDIYLGAIPWVVLQLILVAILIIWPQTVTFMLDAPPKVDPNMIEQQLRNLPGLDNPPPLELGPPKL